LGERGAASKGAGNSAASTIPRFPLLREAIMLRHDAAIFGRAGNMPQKQALIRAQRQDGVELGAIGEGAAWL